MLQTGTGSLGKILEGFSSVYGDFLWPSDSCTKDGDSTISLYSLFLCLSILTVKKFLLKRNFLYFYLFPMPLVLSLGTNKKSLALSSFPPPLVLSLGTKAKSLALSLLLSSQMAPACPGAWGCSSPGTGGLCLSLY